MTQPTTDYGLPTTEPRSGFDLDIWGGRPTNPPVIPIRGGSAPCVLKDERGRCPIDCRVCEEFRDS